MMQTKKNNLWHKVSDFIINEDITSLRQALSNMNEQMNQRIQNTASKLSKKGKKFKHKLTDTLTDLPTNSSNRRTTILEFNKIEDMLK